VAAARAIVSGSASKAVGFTMTSLSPQCDTILLASLCSSSWLKGLIRTATFTTLLGCGGACTDVDKVVTDRLVSLSPLLQLAFRLVLRLVLTLLLVRLFVIENCGGTSLSAFTALLLLLLGILLLVFLRRVLEDRRIAGDNEFSPPLIGGLSSKGFGFAAPLSLGVLF
jgi:hypothetical protein